MPVTLSLQQVAVCPPGANRWGSGANSAPWWRWLCAMGLLLEGTGAPWALPLVFAQNSAGSQEPSSAGRRSAISPSEDGRCSTFSKGLRGAGSALYRLRNWDCSDCLRGKKLVLPQSSNTASFRSAQRPEHTVPSCICLQSWGGGVGEWKPQINKTLPMAKALLTPRAGDPLSALFGGENWDQVFKKNPLLKPGRVACGSLITKNIYFYECHLSNNTNMSLW